MKTNTVIVSATGERIVTSTTETLRVKAADVQPGDYLMSPRHRVLRRERPVTKVEVRGGFAYLHSPLSDPLKMLADLVVEVERTT